MRRPPSTKDQIARFNELIIQARDSGMSQHISQAWGVWKYLRCQYVEEGGIFSEDDMRELSRLKAFLSAISSLYPKDVDEEEDEEEEQKEEEQKEEDEGSEPNEFEPYDERPHENPDELDDWDAGNWEDCLPETD